MDMKALTLQSTDLLRLMQSDWTRRAIRLVNLILVVWIAWLLATMTWSLLAKPEPADTAIPETAVVTAQTSQQDELVRQLPNWHLFGMVAPEAVPVKQVVPVDAPDTRLKLQLHGTFSSADPALARAIIADERGNEEMYAVGDMLPGNAELSEIQPDRVILLRGGRYETLRLPREDTTAGGSVSLSAAGPSRYNTTNMIGNSTTGRLRSLRQTLKRNPKSLFGLVRTIPKKDEKGRMIGYILQPGREPELFQQMGLRPGDVVTRINDINLDNLASGMRALRSVQSGDAVSMTVLRGEQQENLSFRIPE
jgi:general secretion pathway protein C